MIQIDMPMPDNCGECRFNVSEFGYCNAMPVNFCGQVNDFEEDGRPEWCPLKEQKPRVMTLEEVKQWCEIHPHKQNPIWVEFQHGHGTNGWRVGLVNSGLLAWCKDNEARCWTSRPTDEVREATPWG